MKTFGTIAQNDYTVEELYSSAPLSWQLISSSVGVVLDGYEDYLDGSVTVQRASSVRGNTATNADTGVLEYILHKSVSHLFYTNNIFYNQNIMSSQSLTPIANNCYVISIGQTFYGDRIKPGSFDLSTNLANKSIKDDAKGNLYYSESGNTYYIGNIFYNQGIAIVTEDSSSAITAVSSSGLKIVNGTELYIDYSSDVKYDRHEINVKIEPTEFNFSPFNPSIISTYDPTGSNSGSFITSMSMQNISPTSGSSGWGLYRLMGDGVIKPYVTTIGLYNDRYELLAVAKMSQPIQRTFDANQIFIVRFDT